MTGTRYRWNAEEYERHSSNQAEWARELIAKMGLEGNEAVLDIGCGDGKITAAIAALLPRGHIIGIDSSAEMIRLARQRHSGSRIAFEHRDVRALADRERFDVVFSNAALHWVKDHLPVLRRVRRSLKTGGRLVFQMGGRGNAREVVAVLEDLSRGKWAPFFRNFSFPYGFYGVEEYRRWLKTAGLQPRRVELIAKDMRHRGPGGLAGWLRTTWLPYLERVPAEREEDFIEDILQEYLKRLPPDPCGIAHVAMMRLEVEAVKP